jgi:outer membrane protein assembly factor BamC
MKLLKLKKALYALPLFLVGSGCSLIFDDRIDDYLKEKESKPLKILSDSNIRPVVDFYPLPEKSQEGIEKLYDVPMPQQVFSSGTSNEVRLHRLGEIRWIYVETLPSSVWPIMKDFWGASQFGMMDEDPNLGVIQSKSLLVDNLETKLIMKIEHGIRQASSEVFVSHLYKTENEEWVRLSGENNLEEKVLLSALDFLSESSSKGGTSLVALNLNIGQKAILKQNEDLSNFIELNLEFPRAWAAVDRALKEALITVTDLDRNEGVFYVDFTNAEEKGFVRGLFTKDITSKGTFRIVIKKIEDNKCIVTVGGDSEDSKIFERDLLSEINQSLS